jgi:hypothetical protein
VLAIEPKAHGFKPVRDDGFLKAIKFCSASSFRGELKPLAACRKMLLYVKEAHKYEKRYSVGKSHDYLSRSFSYFADGISAANCQIAVVDESGINRTQMGTLIDLK